MTSASQRGARNGGPVRHSNGSRAVGAESAKGGRTPPELLVINGDPWSRKAVEVLKSMHIVFRVTEVSPQDYESPRQVPKLLTDSGMYVGLPSIERVARHEYAIPD